MEFEEYIQSTGRSLWREPAFGVTAVGDKDGTSVTLNRLKGIFPGCVFSSMKRLKHPETGTLYKIWYIQDWPGY